MELVDHLSRLQYIDGAWVESSNKQTREIINPYNQAVILEVAEGTAEDSDGANLAARRAFEAGTWANETSENRGTNVRAIAKMIERHREELATLETLDTGKTVEES